MPFRDHRIAGSNRGSKIATCGAIERERKIIRAKNDDGADRHQNRPDVQLQVDRRKRPGAIARRGGRLTQLPGRPGQLDIGQPRSHGQGGLQVRLLDQFGLSRVEPLGKLLQEPRDLIGRLARNASAASVGRESAVCNRSTRSPDIRPAAAPLLQD